MRTNCYFAASDQILSGVKNFQILRLLLCFETAVSESQAKAKFRTFYHVKIRA